MRVALLVGIPGAGKSTLAAKFHAAWKVLSLDKMRGNRARQLAELRSALRAGQSVVVDNSNLTRERRAEVLEAARGVALVDCYYFPPNVAAAIAQNAARENQVPVIAIVAAAKRLEFDPPTLAEGFATLRVMGGQRE